MDGRECISIEELAAKIALNPLQWVLFLGNGVSYNSEYDRKSMFAKLAREAGGEKEEAVYVREMIYQAVRHGDYAGISNALFGETWDGTSFLDATGKSQMKWRKKFAKELRCRERININCADVNIEDILKVFPGIILTTCQDETIEAFLEYEKSVPVDDIIYTPYLLAASEELDKWIRAEDSGREKMILEDGTQENHLLVKLYGSSRNPYRMLLSEKDYRDYYPDNLKEWMPNTMRFLEKVFRTKNILFVGTDFDREGALSYGKGILKLLESGAGNGERYIFCGDWRESEKYGIRRVKSGNCGDGITEFGRELRSTVQGFSENLSFSGTVSEKAGGKGQICQALFKEDALGSRSRCLHRILSFYGNVFPIGFLTLLSENNEELLQWKRAGIQLADSSIYMKRQQRKNLHERMIYADALMETAGTNPKKEKFRNIICEINYWMGESYFCSLDSGRMTAESEKTEECLKQIFQKMLKKLHDILRDKSEGYNRVHFLLQTELSSIIALMGKLGNCQPECAPALLYYLLYENCAVSENQEILKELIYRFLTERTFCTAKEDKENMQGRFLDRVMLLLAESMIAARSCKREGQEHALEKIAEAERLFASEDWEAGQWNGMPENIFVQRIQICILKSKVYGRCGTIYEISGCRKEVQAMLEAMRENLEYAEHMICVRENWLGNGYEELRAELHHLTGEYYFKMGQYCRKNRKYSYGEKKKEEEESYSYSEMFYKKALEYYDKYPHRFWIQRAEMMRRLADVYCQKEKSIGGCATGEKIIWREKAYQMLIEAYVLYRGNSDLHGIADVLQSMGHLDDFRERREGIRSPVCFYKAAKNAYDYLNDEWSSFVVSKFLQSADRAEKSAAALLYETERIGS